MSDLEDRLSAWTAPSSDSEKDKQDRTERMMIGAVDEHDGFEDCKLSVYAKGSYPNNTNVRADSDVDIAVQCLECIYWEEEETGDHPDTGKYEGVWTPALLRSELVAALKSKFDDQVDTSSSTAIDVNSSSARVDADVVPCFTYRYYYSGGKYREGTKIFKKTGASTKNYPSQHLERGRAKNTATNHRFKKAVRILKRLVNEMEEKGEHRSVPPFFVECLVYNTPDTIIKRTTWEKVVRGILGHVHEELEGSEPDDPNERWLEVSECKYLFHSSQKWTRKDGRDFAYSGWNYLDLG